MATNLRERAESGSAKTATVSAPRDPDPTPEAVPIQVALARVMADVRAVGKDQLHKSQTAGTWKFRGIDDVLNAVGPALRRHGVLTLPEVLAVNYRDVQTKGGSAAREVTVQVRYTFVGPDGTERCAVVPGESLDAGDKGTAKAMSVAYRVALIQVLALPTDQPDPDSEAYEREAPAPDPMVAARAELLAACRANRWDTTRVAQVFETQHGMSIPESDADTVRAFTAALSADPSHVLGKTDGTEK